MRFEFPDEDIMLIRDCNIPGLEEGLELGSRWTHLFDGASNAHGNDIGGSYHLLTGFHLPFTPRLCFECTNNMAEYKLVSLVLKLLLILGSKFLKSTEIQPWSLAKSKEIEKLEIINASLTRSMFRRWSHTLTRLHSITSLERKISWSTPWQLYHPCLRLNGRMKHHLFILTTWMSLLSVWQLKMKLTAIPGSTTSWKVPRKPRVLRKCFYHRQEVSSEVVIQVLLKRMDIVQEELWFGFAHMCK